MTEPVECIVVCDATAPGQARGFVRSTLNRWNTRCVLAEAELLLSELVTNSVVHSGCSQVRVALSSHDETVRLEVVDTNPTTTFQPRVPGPGTEGGFGLRILEAVAPRWGFRSDNDTKSVWCELDLPPDRPHALAV
ncbi:hypothetical protein BH10ACT3_BH10ACT3_02600 [soil metagenome]